MIKITLILLIALAVACFGGWIAGMWYNVQMKEWDKE